MQQAGYCVGYQEFFTSGDTDGGSYQCQLTLSDPDGWTLQPGGPSPSPQAFQQNPFVLPPTPTLPPVELPPVEVPAPLGLLPELDVATAVAVLLPTNSPNDDAYQSKFGSLEQHSAQHPQLRLAIHHLWLWRKALFFNIEATGSQHAAAL
jgi:hypothetical protein